MSIFKYKDVEQHLNDISHDVKSALEKIEDELIKARDREKDKLPVYLTKWRKKGLSSTYLKTKRKHYDNLNKITDYGGLRALCLFEQDILHVHNFIINNLIGKKNLQLTLREFCVFNWEENEGERLKKIVEDNISYINKKNINSSKKGSGYRSVHYIIEVNSTSHTCIEIQLRTLLQDAWGELEHALGYKQGGVHPHIRKSFKLLSQDLTTNDALISHLKNISEHECILRNVKNKNAIPFRFFSYSKDLYSIKFLQDTALMKELESYEEYVKNNNEHAPVSWAKEAQKRIDKIADKFTANEQRKDKKFDYWFRMEKAYIDFQEGKIEKAHQEYQNIIDNQEYKKTYITYFRLGDTATRLGQTVKAFIAFDDAKKLYDDDDSMTKEQEADGYYIKSKLAYIYWEMGEQFYEIALKEMRCAEKNFYNAKDILEKNNDREKEKMLNHLCWYNLELFILDNRKINFLDTAETHFTKLVSIVESENNKAVSIETLDSCAWFSYQKYLHTKDKETSNNVSEEWIKAAHDFCKLMIKKNMQDDVCVGFLDDDLMKSHYLVIEENYKKF